MHLDLMWRLEHGITCAFSTAADGDLRDPLLRRGWLQRIGAVEPCAVMRQVHAVEVIEADPTMTPLAAADAQVSAGGMSLMVFGADCPGLCVAAPDVFAVAHCGWRGTAAGIAGALVAAVARRSRQPPSQYAALIGPGIAWQEYEVDEPVLSARQWPPEAIRPSRTGHAWLDLTAAIAADLRAAGVVAVTRAVPRTSRDNRLWSYRQHGPGLVQGLVAWRG